MEYRLDFPELDYGFQETGLQYEGKQYAFDFRVDYRLHHYRIPGASKECDPVSVRSLANDLIDIAASIYVADRIMERSKKHSSKRKININLPVSNARRLATLCVDSNIRKIARWYSPLDIIDIHFTKRESPRYSDVQSILDFNGAEMDRAGRREVALWSGGLDSLSGLAKRNEECTDTHFHLIGAGGNSEVFGIQRRLSQMLKSPVESRHNSLDLSKVSFDCRGLPFHSSLRNSAPRLRGLVFLLVGAAKAIVANQDRLYLYENGVGAINLPFGRGIGGIEHTRSVHPESLRLVSKFVSKVRGRRFKIINPFLWINKSEMCSFVKGSDILEDASFKSVTCDSKPRIPGAGVKIRHCGVCSSCILRRIGFKRSGINDETNYVCDRPKTNEAHQSSSSCHEDSMCAQVRELEKVLRQPSPKEGLAAAYPELIDVARSVSRQGSGSEDRVWNEIISLYQRYVADWKFYMHSESVSPVL